MAPRSPVASGSLAAMASAAKRIMLKLPIRFTVITFWNSSKLCAPFFPTIFSAGAIPAQFTKPISLPKPVAAATTALPSFSSATLAFTKTPPISAATLWPNSSFISAMTTLPPLAASMRAVPSPKPCAPPVTINTFPAISMKISSSYDVNVNHTIEQKKPRKKLAGL